MLFFPCGGKLKIHFLALEKLREKGEPSTQFRPLENARYTCGKQARERYSCSINNSDTHAIYPFQYQ